MNFDSPRAQDRPTYLVIGIVGAHTTERSNVAVEVNGATLPVQVAPATGHMSIVYHPTTQGAAEAIGVAAHVAITELGISIGTATAVQAASLYIKNAPTDRPTDVRTSLVNTPLRD